MMIGKSELSLKSCTENECWDYEIIKYEPCNRWM